MHFFMPYSMESKDPIKPYYPDEWVSILTRMRLTFHLPFKRTFPMTTRHSPTVELEAVADTILGNLGIDPQLTLSLGIVNNTGRDLTVVTRSGLKFVLPSHRCVTDRSVFFREGFAITSSAQVGLNPSNAPFTEEPTTAQRLYDGMRERISRSSTVGGRPRDAVVSSRISLDTLIEGGGTVYVPALDVVVSVHSNRAVILHPYSDEGVREQMRVIDIDDASFRYAMYIVDNHRTYGDRYVNLNGKIFRVPCVFRPEVADGFYAVHPIPTMVGGVVTEYQVVQLSLKEAEKQYALHRTPEEAETYGFSKEALERENLTRKREQAQRAEEREETKQERTDRLARQKEAEDAAARDHENRQAVRRDIVDMVKFISAITVAVTGFCITVLKLKKG